MDEIDRKILTILLKSGNKSMSSLSRDIGISVQLLNYRLNRMLQNSIIKGFRTYINPHFLGGKNLFVAYQGTQDLNLPRIGAVFKCLERTDFYEIQAMNHEELYETVNEMDMKFGKQIMRYEPRIETPVMNLSRLDLLILKELIKDPILKPGEISDRINIRGSLVMRKLRRMADLGLYRVLPIIDLSTTGIYVYVIISNSIFNGEIKSTETIIRIKDQDVFILVAVSDSISKIKSIYNTVKAKNREAELMLVYDYDFKTSFSEKIIEEKLKNFQSQSV